MEHTWTQVKRGKGPWQCMLQWLLPALLLTVWMKGMNRVSSKQAYSSSITATPVYDLVELLLSVQCLQISFNCKDILNFRCWEAEQQQQQQQQQCGHQLSFTILSRAGGCWLPRPGRLLGLSTLCGWSPEHWTGSIQTRVPQFWTLTLLKSHYILCYTTVGRFEMPECIYFESLYQISNRHLD